ncbi:MAG: apolipoprotein N-acyltransferase, partial [Parcubacteria group bacterium Gr01-1014_44]
GFILFFLAIKILKSAESFKLGFFIGLVYFLIYFRWYWAVFPLKHLGIDNPVLAFFFIFFVWIFTAGPMALLWGAGARLWKTLDEKISWPALLVFPSIFTVLEFLRSYLIGLVWMGRQTPIGPNWTNGNLTYNLHGSFLTLKLASWFGIYGVTFLVVFISLFLFILWEKRKYKKLLITALSLIFFLYFPALQDRPVITGRSCNVPCIEVAIIQTKIPSQSSYTSGEESAFFKDQLTLVNSIRENFPETKLVVLPEASNFFKTVTLFRNTAGASQYFSGLFAHPALIVDNSKIITDSGFQSKTIFLDSKKGILGSYDKHLLTPGGEYIPFLFRAMDIILGLNSPAIKNAPEYKTGSHPPEAIIFSNELSAASLICSDIFSPFLAQKGAINSKVLVAQSSFGFAKDAPDLLRQDLAAAKFRAAESSRYLVKASNFGRSFIISDRGSLEKITPNLDSQILTGSVVLKDNKTLYNKVGDGPILLASLMVVLASLFWRGGGEQFFVKT